MQQSINIQITPDELRDLIREEIKGLSQPHPEKAESVQDYLTKKELATFARMSLGLVNDLSNKGIFTRHRIGGKVLYSRQQVLTAIQSGAAVKYARK
jgi:hypothetical protein